MISVIGNGDRQSACWGAYSCKRAHRRAAWLRTRGETGSAYSSGTCSAHERQQDGPEALAPSPSEPCPLGSSTAGSVRECGERMWRSRTCGCGLCVGYGEQLPVAGYTLELIGATFRKPDSRPCDEIGDGARHEDVPAITDRSDSRTDVDRDPADLLPSQFDLTGVETHSHVDAERSQAVAQLATARDRPRWPVERGEHTIAGEVDKSSPVGLDLSPYNRVVSVEDLTPASIAYRRCLFSGADDV